MAGLAQAREENLVRYLYKSLCNTKGRVYPSLPRVVVPGGGRSPISRTADAAPGGSLSARGDNGVNVVKCIGSV